MRSYIWEILHEHDSWIIRVEYPKLVSNQAKLIIENGINDQAVRREFVEWITIDWIESLDLDDAIWAEETSKWYAAFVHISDVTEAIKIYTPADVEALKRTTSIYRANWVINMFPDILSQDKLSLNENWDKLTLSIRIDLDFEGRIIWYKVFESKFKSLKRHDYDSFMVDLNNQDSEYYETFQLMNEIARKRKKIRVREWADISFKDDDRQLSVWEHPDKVHLASKKIPSSIIMEFMLAANEVGAMVCSENNYDSIFRLHDSIDERAYYHNMVWRHSWLALLNYSHFTSPIRRYADMVLHRVLKLVHLRWEDKPYTSKEILEITKHINITREVLEILWREADYELKAEDIVNRARKRACVDRVWLDWLFQHIRECLWNWKKLSQIVVDEIIHDLENWDVWKRATWLWLLFFSRDNRLKEALKKALIYERKISPKSIFSLLNNSKLYKGDDKYLFEIREKEKNDKYMIIFKFNWKVLFRRQKLYWSDDKKYVESEVRFKVIHELLDYFYWK